MKSNKRKGVIGLILILAVCFVRIFRITSADKIKLGLDLDGGVSITYQAVGEKPTAEEMADTRYKLQQRVEAYSSESEVYLEGDNRINIDIPGVSDANAILEELGKPGSLEFSDMEGNTILTGDDVATAEAGAVEPDRQNEYVVALRLPPRAQRSSRRRPARVGKQIAIVYDGELVSALWCRRRSPAATARSTVWRIMKRRDSLLPRSVSVLSL